MCDSYSCIFNDSNITENEKKFKTPKSGRNSQESVILF